MNQKAFSTIELIKVNVSSSFVSVTHNGKSLITQLVPLLNQTNLFEVSTKIIIFDKLKIKISSL